MPRLNIFENYPIGQRLRSGDSQNHGSLYMNGYCIPGSISFNNVAVLFQGAGTTAKTATINFGLYSLNGATLSLANSASISTAPTANTTHWLTMNTSATQDITPGNWYFGYLILTSSAANMLAYACSVVTDLNDGAMGGPFVRGWLSASTSALPASIATSDMIKEGDSTTTTALQFQPYIIISA